jgi:hypothetical protein
VIGVTAQQSLVRWLVGPTLPNMSLHSDRQWTWSQLGHLRKDAGRGTSGKQWNGGGAQPSSGLQLAAAGIS